MKLHLRDKVTTKKKRRIGRGYSSGRGGHTVGKGMKGQKSRSGFKKLRMWLKTSKLGSLPKLRGIGKRSAKRGYAKQHINKIVLNLSDLEEFDEATVVNKAFLSQKGLIDSKSKKAKVKILGDGKLTKKLTIQNIPVSKKARKMIEKAGGEVNN